MPRRRRIQTIKCPNCLEEIDALEITCRNCGSNVEELLRKEVDKREYRIEWEKAMQARENPERYEHTINFGTLLKVELKHRLDNLAEMLPKKSKRQIVEEALELYFEQPEIKKLIKQYQ